MKLQKHPIKLLVMGFSDDEKTVVQREADSVHGDCPIEKLHEYFSHEERKTDCCYALYDYEGKLILIKWLVSVKILAILQLVMHTHT